MPIRNLTPIDQEILGCASCAVGTMLQRLKLTRPYDEILSTAVVGAMEACTSFDPTKSERRGWLIAGACAYILLETRRAARHDRRNAGSVVEGGVQMHQDGAHGDGDGDGEGDEVVAVALARGEANGALCGGSAGLAQGAEELLSGRGDPKAGAALREVFDGLNEENRALLHRRFGDRMSLKALGEETGASEGKVRARIQRAALAMRDGFMRRGDAERPECLSAPRGVRFPEEDDHPASSRRAA